MLDVPGSQDVIFGEVKAARPGALAIAVERQRGVRLPFEPGTRLSGTVVLPDSRGSFYATVAKIDGHTVVLHELSEIRIEGGCRMFRRKCDLQASYRLVWPSPQRRPEPGRRHAMGYQAAKPARCLDISVGGLALELGEQVWAGDRLWIQIGLPGCEAPVAAVVEVVWSEDIAQEHTAPRKAGFRFIEVLRADAARIKAFVNGEGQAEPSTSSYLSSQGLLNEPVPNEDVGMAVRSRLSDDILVS
jgi:hypothetical protein